MSLSAAQCCACGVDLCANSLLCPACRRLVYADELKRAAAEAEERTNSGDLNAARDAWKQALELLPGETVQYSAVAERLAQIERRIAEAAVEHNTARKWKGVAVVGPALVFLVTKGKLLLLGLTNLTTLTTMLASAGVFWSLYGWKFAVGLVVSIYIHEMGHVAAMRRFGMPASAPMFIPGLGAFVLLKQRWLNTAQDARIGLAGPLWGSAAAAVAWTIGAFTKQPIWTAIGAGGAWLNMLNLIPVWNLDGGLAFRALTRVQRAALCALLFVMWMLTAERLVLVLAIAVIYRLFTKDHAANADQGVLAHFALLVVVLALLSLPTAGAEPFRAAQ